MENNHPQHQYDQNAWNEYYKQNAPQVHHPPPSQPPQFPPPGYNPYQYPPGYNPYQFPPMMSAPRMGNQEQFKIPSKGDPTETLYVGNLNLSYTSDKDLRVFFSPFGYIEGVKMLPQKGCAFVRFSNVESAIKAYNTMAGQLLHGRQIKIGWGKGSSSYNDSNQNNSSNTQGPINLPPCTNIWVGNIDFNVTSEQQLLQEFSQFGAVDSIRVLPHKNCAFINFASLTSALNARDLMNGREINGRQLKINFGKSIETKPSTQVQNSAPLGLQMKAAIDEIANEVLARGQEYEDSLRAKTSNDPYFSFLHEGGNHNDYYRWKLFDSRKGNAPTVNSTPPQHSSEHEQTQPSQTEPAVEEEPENDEELTKEEVEELTPLLDDLENFDLRVKSFIISNSKTKLRSIFNIFKKKLRDTTGCKNKIGFLHMIHEILLEGKATKNTKYANKLLPICGTMFQNVWNSAKTDDDREEIDNILDSIQGQGIFDNDVMNTILEVSHSVETEDCPSTSEDDSEERSKKKRSRSEDSDSDNKTTKKKREI